ncbi:hypothetical protein BHM03_00028240 [Ensete ventricosum]|nr:hypothetical protein BHM03_00028240 [Ensete ventricosum]
MRVGPVTPPSRRRRGGPAEQLVRSLRRGDVRPPRIDFMVVVSARLHPLVRTMRRLMTDRASHPSLPPSLPPALGADARSARVRRDSNVDATLTSVPTRGLPLERDGEGGIHARRAWKSSLLTVRSTKTYNKGTTESSSRGCGGSAYQRASFIIISLSLSLSPSLPPYMYDDMTTLHDWVLLMCGGLHTAKNLIN